MGGLGSGNRLRWSQKPICEHNKRIDIRYMRKRGLLRAGAAGSLSWSLAGEPAGDIKYRTHHQSLELDYKYREGGNDWQLVNEQIYFARVPQHFGGERLYFICPRCHRNCMVLYGGAYFRCRKCQGLAYASQNEDAVDRLRRKAEKIRRRLGDDGDLDWPFPEKPKGMHWRTYDALRAKGEALEERHEVVLTWHLNRLVGLL